MQRINALITTLIIGLVLGLPAAAWAGPVNVNTADAATLAAELQGVGMVRARAIVEHREANGAFASASELMEVKGIGPGIYEVNRSDILVESGDATVADDG